MSKNAGTREKGMRNMLERMQEQVYNDSQTDERNWANLLERIRYNKSSEDITMSSRSYVLFLRKKMSLIQPQAYVS